MSNFFETVLATLVGIASYYLLEGLYYEAKYRLAGKRYENFLDDLEEDSVTF
jgi:hypothetical protein